MPEDRHRCRFPKAGLIRLRIASDERPERRTRRRSSRPRQLIAEAQRLLKAYVESKRVHPDAVINDLLWLLDGPRQREAQRLVREALGEDFANNA